MKFKFEVVSTFSTPALDTMLVDEVEELEDLLDDALRSHDDSQPFVINLHRPPGDVLNVAECFGVLYEHLTRSGDVGGDVRVEVRTERVANALRRKISRGENRRSLTYGPLVLDLVQGDITKIACDAIVNASNTRLRLGSGVSGAIRRAAGAGLQADMASHAPLTRGTVVVTSSHGMAFTRKILHVATSSGHVEDIRMACAAILTRADSLKFNHIAIPAIGAGVGSMPASTCAQLMVEAVQEFKPRADSQLATISYVLWDAETWKTFVDIFTQTLDTHDSF